MNKTPVGVYEFTRLGTNGGTNCAGKFPCVDNRSYKFQFHWGQIDNGTDHLGTDQPWGGSISFYISYCVCPPPPPIKDIINDYLRKRAVFYLVEIS